MLKRASMVIGGLIGAISVIFAFVVYKDAGVMSGFWGPPMGHEGPLWASFAGVLLIAGALLTRLHHAEVSFAANGMAIVFALAGGWATGWGFLVVPTVAAAITGALLVVRFRNEGPVLDVADHWFAD